MNPEKKDRNDKVIALWNSGLSYTQIGEKMGITREAAAAIVYAALERERYKKKFGELAELPPRVMNSVLRAGIKVTHVIDETRKKKQEKHEQLETAKEKRKKSMYKKIVKDGWKSLEEMEKQRAYKLLSPEEISAAIKESEIIKPEQMTMFDFI